MNRNSKSLVMTQGSIHANNKRNAKNGSRDSSHNDHLVTNFTLPRVDMVVQGQQIKNALHRDHCSPHHSPCLSNVSRSLHSSSTHSSTNKSPDVVRRNKKFKQDEPKNVGGCQNKHSQSHTMSTDQNNASNSSIATTTSPYTTNVHSMIVSELEKLFRTDIETGLDSAYADYLLKEVGYNMLTPPEKESEFVKWLQHVFLGVFNILLWVASAAQLLFYCMFPDNRDKLDLLVPCILSFVVVTAGTFQWYQERSSEQIMASFANMAPQQVTVIRSGQHKQIEATELVPGDVVILTAGSKLPADVRIIESSSDMQVDNASLTGESEPQSRSINCTSKNPMESENIGFLGTLLLKGKGKAIVYYTGDDTLLGKIAALAGKSKKEKTTFTKEVEHFVSMIAWVAVLIGVFCMVYDLIYENNVKQSLYSAVCIIIANIPEGLIPAVTLALTLSAKRMSHRQVLVRNLESIETLGCVSVICSDKTGTITCGTMSVSHVFKLGKRSDQLETYQARQLKSQYHKGNDPATTKLMNAAILCNNSTISKNTDTGSNEYQVNGFPTEAGIFRAAVPVVGGFQNVQQLRQDYPIAFEIPFNSDNKWHLTIHEYPAHLNKKGYLMQIKGAPERIIELCKDALISEHEIVELTDEMKNKVIMKHVTEAATYGERVLCFAYAHIDIDENNQKFIFKGDHFDTANWSINGVQGGFGQFTFLGFMSLIDPPRKGVESAIHQCYQAGIKVVMVTGDYEVTAAAIARQVGIIRDNNIAGMKDGDSFKKRKSENEEFIINIKDSDTASSRVVTGEQIERILDANANGDIDMFNHFWDHVLSYDCLVFARTTPMHKMIIVEQFQKRGMIVAVTGDGVNDAPALNQANVGIAMGKNGTDVAREASDIILMDDNFASIVSAVEEGRLITDNIKKCIAYTLCSKLPQLAPILARNWFGIPLALTMMQVLLIDLGTDIWTGVFMAYEKKEDDIMKRQPRDIKKQPMVTWKLMMYSYLHIGALQTLGCFLAYQQIMYNEGNGVNFMDFWNMDGSMWNKWGAGSGQQAKDLANIVHNENLDDHDFSKHDSAVTDVGTTSGAGSSEYGQTLFCYSHPYVCEFSNTVDYTKTYHHHLSAVQQKILLRRAQTGFYVSLIIMQICAALCCQTRLASLFTSGFQNKKLNACLVLELLFGIAVVYMTELQDLFETESLEPACWFAVAPFAILMLIIEELRKYYARLHPKGWVRQTLVW